jgi:hypothetical protein
MTTNPQAQAQEIARLQQELRTLKDAVWHALDNSCTYSGAEDEITIEKEHYDRLAELVPEDWVPAGY